MQKSLVSVIITTYKREPWMLKRAVDSVISQTYDNIEIIVVDDSPSDFEKRAEVKDLILGYGFILYIEHSTNLGASQSRNDGIEASNGDYIAFLDDDDEWFPEKIAKQVDKMQDNIGIVYCREYIIDSVSGDKQYLERNYHTGMVFKYLITENFIGGNSFVLINRKAFEECGYFANIKSAQDTELFLRISKKFAVDYVAEPLLNYYINHGERITLNPYNKIQGFEYLNHKYRFYLFFHPKKKAIRLSKLLYCYKIVDTKKYVITLLKIIALTPFKLKQNYYHLLSIKNEISKNKRLKE